MSSTILGRASRPRAVGVRADLLALGIVVGALLLLTSLPYAYGYISTPPGKQFMGILFNVPDNAQYLAWAREFGRSLLIENTLTPEQGDPLFFNLFWLVIGRLSFATGIGAAEVLQLVRLVAGALYLGAIYWFIGVVVGRPLHRWISFAVVALGGGLGWVLVVYKQFSGILPFPLDLYVFEPNTLLTVMASPYQAMAGALLVMILGLSALALERDSIHLSACAGALALLLGIQHGYDLLIVYAVVGSTALLLMLKGASRHRTLLLGSIICVPSAPVAGYLVYLTSTSPIWRGVLAQYGNAGVYTPPPAHLLVLLGLPLFLVLALPEPSKASIGREPRELLLGCWLVVGFLLLYIPTDFQIKMLTAWQVPVGILATRVALAQMGPTLDRARHLAIGQSEMMVGVLLIALVLPVNGYLYSWRLVDLARHDYPYYLQQDELEALRWLEANSPTSSVVLSSLTIGQYLPSVSGNRPFLAHWAQTLDFYRKQAMVEEFFRAGASGEELRMLATQYRVDYVFHGRPEREIGDYDPGESPYLIEVFSRGETSVYRIADVER